MTQRALNRFGNYHGETSANLVAPGRFMDFGALLEELDDGTDLGFTSEEPYWVDIDEVGLPDDGDEDGWYEMVTEDDRAPENQEEESFWVTFSQEETSLEPVSEEYESYFSPALQYGRTHNNRVVRSQLEERDRAKKRENGSHSKRGHGRQAQVPWKIHAGLNPRDSIRYFPAPEAQFVETFDGMGYWVL